jgi:sterol desaturase/sphingolipid hydroxylase (fatty acid hydroxylase superfamily)
VIAPFAISVWLLAKLGGPHVEAFAPIGAWGGPWALLAASLLALDLSSYLLHRLQHAVFPPWPLRAVHHADIDVDATTSVRHHPFEAALNGMALVLIVLTVGIPPWALPVYAAIVQLLELGVHANVRLPARVDRALGLIVITPGLHRTHHAASPEYYNTNFGAVLTVWDRALRTLAAPLPERDAPGFGVPPYLSPRYATAYWALWMPFAMRVSDAGDEPAAPPPPTLRTPPGPNPSPATGL